MGQHGCNSRNDLFLQFSKHRNTHKARKLKSDARHTPKVGYIYC